MHANLTKDATHVSVTKSRIHAIPSDLNITVNKRRATEILMLSPYLAQNAELWLP